MLEDQRPTSNRFVGGVKNRLDNLINTLQFVESHNPEKEELFEWFTANTRLGTKETFIKHVRYIVQIGLLEYDGESLKEHEGEVRLGPFGRKAINTLADQNQRVEHVIFEALSNSTQGYDHLLRELESTTITIEDRARVLNEAYSNQESPDTVAQKHYNWLEAIDYIKQDSGQYILTELGQEGAKSRLSSSNGDSVISPNNLFLAPCSRTHKDTTYKHFRETVLEGVDIQEFEAIPDFGQDSVSMWGVVSGNKSHWEAMEPGDVLLFYTETKLYSHKATVLGKQKNEELASEVWTPFDEGRQVEDFDEVWPYIIYVTDIKEVNIPSPDLHSDIGWGSYYPQSFTRVIDERRDKIEKKYGSIAACLRHHSSRTAVGDPDAVSEQKSSILEPPTEYPPLTEEQDYTSETTRVRSRAFRNAVYESYDSTCAVCGSHRKSLAGFPEIEAAHIYPKSEGGVDDIRNGIALCKFHHWAFDTGWFSIEDDYKIVVRDRPERETYRDIGDLEGKSIQLPENVEHQPHVKFLSAHRKFHGFDTE